MAHSETEPQPGQVHGMGRVLHVVKHPGALEFGEPGTSAPSWLSQPLPQPPGSLRGGEKNTLLFSGVPATPGCRALGSGCPSPAPPSWREDSRPWGSLALKTRDFLSRKRQSHCSSPKDSRPSPNRRFDLGEPFTDVPRNAGEAPSSEERERGDPAATFPYLLSGLAPCAPRPLIRAKGD